MARVDYDYVIIGGGLAGAAAIEGIRDRDPRGAILLLSAEMYRPYHRPPLSKQLWFGKKNVEQIFVYSDDFYAQHDVTLVLGRRVMTLEAREKFVTDAVGQRYHYGKLLLATGTVPRQLTIPGGDLEGIYYFRDFDDYQRMRAQARPGRSALVIGGGFIGSELAAALQHTGLKVTMVYPGAYLCHKVFPVSLGQAMQARFAERGITIYAHHKPMSLTALDRGFVARLDDDTQITADIVLVGVGVAPDSSLAEQAGLKVDNGIVVNEYLQTSETNIYAAGDNANYPYAALGKHMRVEHWDNALMQGKQAGRNMAGAAQPYDHMPYFFSDLFEFGYEAVGEVDARLEMFADWRQENDTGVIYYLGDGKVRGVMLCNVWDKVDAARELIRKGETVTPEALRGAIH